MERLWSAPDTNFEGKGIQVGESLSVSKVNMYSALAGKILTQGELSCHHYPLNT